MESDMLFYIKSGFSYKAPFLRFYFSALVNHDLNMKSRAEENAFFEIKKGRLSFRLTESYSGERRQRASEYAKENGLKGR